MHLASALEKYLTQLVADGRAEPTLRQHARHVRLLERWLRSEDRSCEIDAITHETLAAFLSSPTARLRANGAPKKGRSTNATRTSLRCFFGYLHRAGVVRLDATRLVRQARCSPPPPRSLSDQERQRLLDTLSTGSGREAERARALFGTMLLAGTRLGATLSITTDDVDLERAEIRVRRDKNDRPDIVILPPDLVEILRAYLATIPPGPLFEGRPGKPLGTRQAQRLFREVAGLAGINAKATCHWLRHTYAVRLWRRTSDIALVQRALNHRSVASTMAYVRVPDQRLREALRG